VDTPESYPHDMGISYPHLRRGDFQGEKVIPTDQFFIHSNALFIPMLSTCGWPVDKLSTGAETAFQAALWHIDKSDNMPKQAFIHISTAPTATTISFYFLIKKES
jgi:hypothetical protein